MIGGLRDDIMHLPSLERYVRFGQVGAGRLNRHGVIRLRPRGVRIRRHARKGHWYVQTFRWRLGFWHRMNETAYRTLV